MDADDLDLEALKAVEKAELRTSLKKRKADDTRNDHHDERKAKEHKANIMLLLSTPSPSAAASQPALPQTRAKHTQTYFHARGSYTATDLKPLEAQHYKTAGVLAGLRVAGRVYTLLCAEIRKGSDDPQLTFLCGKREDTDEGARATAWREMLEESGQLCYPLQFDEIKCAVFWFQTGRCALYPIGAPRNMLNIDKYFVAPKDTNSDSAEEEPLCKSKHLVWVDVESLLDGDEDVLCLRPELTGRFQVYKMVREICEEVEFRKVAKMTFSKI